MSYQQEKFKEIADKIRELTDTTELIVPNEFATRLDDVYEAGRVAGGGDGEVIPDADVMEFPLEGGSIGRVSTDSEYYDDIARKILSLPSQVTPPLKPSQMGDAIEQLTNDVYKTGQEIGKVEGRQAQYDEFWNKFQNNGNNTSYYYAFTAPYWTDETYTPKYVIKSTNMQRTFFDTKITNTKVPIDVRSSSGAAMSNAFRDAGLETIVEIMVTDVIQYNSTFLGCSKLKEIRFSGTIGQNLDISESPLLSDASVANIKEHLYDFPNNGSTETRFIKFH